MGEYGTPNIDIEEGFIEITHKGRTDVLPYPKQPGSFYHLSKVHDSHNIMFACRIWGLRATDLNQGIVYGHRPTKPTSIRCWRPASTTTACSGPCSTASACRPSPGIPLTVYGAGGQTRGMLNIRDTLACVTLAIENPPPRRVPGLQPVHRVLLRPRWRRWSRRVARPGRYRRGLDRPRVENEEHYFHAANTKLLDLGLEPHLLTDEVISGICSSWSVTAIGSTCGRSPPPCSGARAPARSRRPGHLGRLFLAV